MNIFLKPIAAALVASTALSLAAVSQATAETVLRLDEVAVGELDPAKATDYADSILMFNVYDTLVLSRQGGAGVVPHLAESWETDGKTYTFKLRTDVKFQSGNPLTADDVVFSLDRMKTIGQGLSYLFAQVEKAEAVDAGTVKFTLSQPYSPFVSALLRLPIVDKKLVMENLGAGDGDMKDWGQAYLSTHGAGTGAYTVTSHNPQQETVMAKNPAYFLGVPAKAPDTVRFRYGLEAATVRTLISQGEHDISSQWLPPEVLKSLAAEGAQVLTESGGAGFYVKMNTAKKPFDDQNCRLAMSNAFDYATAIKMVAITDTVSQGSPATGALPVGMLGALPETDAYKRDLDAAKKYLAACQYKPDEFTVELSWVGEVPLEERFALLMQANFAEIGIKSEVKKIPWALFTEQVTKPENTPNISQVFVNAVTGDPDTLIYGMYHSSAVGTWQSPEYLKDAKVDELLDKGRVVTSDEERAAVYTEVGNRLRELAPTIFAYDQNSVFAASKRVSVPALSDKSKAFSLSGMGFTFRLMEMNE
ncbi:twin-arginine translocation pathway signal protein [Mesorhizobium sp. L-8-10]|uniref:ABC transporter substrate-binding protein n=1 Tax=Mesorhizobium sp. L-8-10 TaxID=2744523 RepID=UPI0019265E5F|nr:ABC transporter substrate-binding protein [Mesorhizobium sp. L-8-10]BCH35467.1 twin-arginine translocation pathway signal protein [Mesorhizobium sp. L-8-10]